VNTLAGIYRLLTGGLLLLLLLPAQAEVEVSIDRRQVQVNESFQLVFSLDHSPDEEPDFSALQKHFMLLDNSRNNSISIIKGDYKRSVKWVLQLMPKQIGEYIIPAIGFGDESSKPFRISVEPSSFSAALKDQLVLEMAADRSTAFVQSQVIVTIRLLSSDSISAYQFGNLELESLDAVIEPLGDVKQYNTRIADMSYLVLEKQYALFPQQSGRLAIAPLIAEVRLGSRSAFDPFQTGGKIRRIRSQKLFIGVDPLPSEFQAQNWLPANSIELREQWQHDLDQLVAGEPLTRTLTLVADGLTAAQLPDLALPQVVDMKQYPDKPELQDQRSGKGIIGTRQQSVAMIPGSAGSYLIPEFSIRWWNLQTGKVETASIPERRILVRPAVTPVLVEAPVVADMQPAPAKVIIETNQFWIWLSLFLACGWAGSGLLWWLLSRRAAMAGGQSSTPDRLSLGKSRKALRLACENNDASAARSALLSWGRALLAPTRPGNLQQLLELLGDELAHQVDILDRSLYSSSNISWQGADLWQLCQSLEKNMHHPVQGDENPGLLPLNPAA